jgi:hypothetical protein
MIFQPSVIETDPETPLVIVEVKTQETDIGKIFQKRVAEVFESGEIAGKTEEEIIQITAKLLIDILTEYNDFDMNKGFMPTYFKAIC